MASSGFDTGTEACNLCGNRFSPNDLAIVQGNRVCIACKPRYFQMLQAQARASATPPPITRQGRYLVMMKNTPIPYDRCVKCNAPADGKRFVKTMYWHPPWIYVTILAGLLVYAIIALIIRERVLVDAGLCDEHRSKRRKAIAIAWIAVLVSFVLMFSAIPMESGWPALAGFFGFFGAIVYAIIAVPVLGIHKIEGHYVWLRGASALFLDGLSRP